MTRLRKAVAASDVVEGASGRNKRVTKEELKAVVETLVSRGYLKILMNPSLQVVSGKTGKVKSAKASSTSTTEDSFEVTARVLDDGYIELQTRVVLDEKSTPADQNSLLLVTKRELSGTFRIGSGGSCIAGGIEKSVKRPVVGDNPETLEYRTTEELVVLTATIIAAPSNPQPKADVQVERENRIEKLDIETLLSKVRRALQPSDNMRVSWQFETAEPFGWGTTKSPHTVIEYSATISGFKSRLEGLQKTYTSKASEDPYDIRRKTYVFDGKQCRNLEERIKGGNTTNIGWVKPQNVTVELLYQELFACILPLHNKDKLNEYELSLADSPSPGIYVMKIIGPQGDIPYQITIDGSRGFNIINTQWFGAKNRKTLEDTTVLRQYDDGIWYPAERRRMRYYPNGTHKLEHIQTFSKLELDVKVPEETFELEFSPHTIVQGATPGALVIVSDTDTSGKELDVQAAEREARIAAKRLRWLDIKKGGGTKWGSDEWMKEPGYYKELGTEELAEECFSRATFGFEMTIYDDPMYGYSSLEIFHNGFAELFKREDMWKGILHVYDFLSLKLNPKSDLRTIVRVSNDLDAFERMYTIPSFREQVKGREAIFLEANLQVLKRYSQYLEDYDPMASGTKGSPGFFGEPCSVARVALMLAKEVAPERYAGIQPALNSVRWTKGQQKVEELKSYINLVIEGLDGIVSIELERVE